MAEKIMLPVIFDGYNPRKDRTISLRFVTQEQTPQEITKIHSALDNYGILFFSGSESLSEREVKILDEMDTDLNDHPKTQSQRIRNTLYVLWKESGRQGEFKDFYRENTEQYINKIKTMIDAKAH